MITELPSPTQTSEKRITIGTKTFVLNKAKAEKAFNEKKIINGREAPYFNILPLKYPWAYDLYKTMKSNHWEPEDIPMQKDCEHWRDTSGKITEVDRWIIRMGIGYFSAAEGLVGNGILENIREHITAPEIKMVLGRHAQEENIHADSLVYMISSLGINPHECEAMFEDVPSIRAKNSFLERHVRKVKDTTDFVSQHEFLQNIFIFGQCLEGLQFYGLFALLLSLGRQNKFPGISQMFRYTLRDESNHIELLRKIFLTGIEENLTLERKNYLLEECAALLFTSVEIEKEFIEDCIDGKATGIDKESFFKYIEYIANRRAEGVGLTPLYRSEKNPFPWLSEAIDLKKEQNFFEGRVTDYQKASVLPVVNDEEL